MKRSAAEVQKSLRKKLIQAAHKAHTASDFAKRDAMLARARKIAKEAGCEKLPPALRSNCEKKSKGGDEKSEDKGKEASRLPSSFEQALMDYGLSEKDIKDIRKDVEKKKKAPKKAATPKVAVNKETEEFARWVFSTQGPMSPGEVEAFVKRQLGIKTSPPKKKRTGPRYQRGDQVEIKFAKHKDAKSDPGPYKRFDGKIGTVTEVNESDKSCMVAFKGEPAPVRFEGALKTRGVGIYKYTAPYTLQGSAKIEMIYVAGGKPTEDAKLVVDAYVSRGGEKQQRSGNYYTGHVVMASVGGNGYYFRAFPQQRVEMGTEGGFRPRTFNPSKGQVLYVGLFGKRPSNWKRELEKLDKMAMEESAA